MELKTAIIAPKMEEIKFPIESMREGIFAVVFLICFEVWICCCVSSCLLVLRPDNRLFDISVLTMTCVPSEFDIN